MTTSRYIYIAFITLGFVVGLICRSAAEAAVVMGGGVDMALGGILPLSSAIGIAVGLLTVVVLLKNVRVVRFTSQVIGELTKTSWPSRDETTSNSIVVIIATLIFSGSLAVFDFVWLNVTDTIFAVIG